MRRLTRTALIAALLIGGTATGLPETLADQPAAHLALAGSVPASEWRWQECRFQGLTETTWTQHEVAQTIRCAVARWPVYGGAPKALAVAACESGLRANASNGGRYLGVYQHLASAWPSRQNTFNPPTWDKPLAENVFNARANVVVAIRMAHSGGWSPWSCA